MKFQILGPLQVEVDSEPVELPGIRQQVIVATLLLNANRVVAMDRLLEAVYGEDQPPTARAQVQISISFNPAPVSLACSQQGHHHVRTWLHYPAGRRRARRTVFRGNSDRCPGGPRLEQLCPGGREVPRRPPDLERASPRRHRQPAGARGEARLDELRVSTIEDRIALELDLGRHHELVGELAELVDSLREQLRRPADARAVSLRSHGRSACRLTATSVGP